MYQTEYILTTASGVYNLSKDALADYIKNDMLDEGDEIKVAEVWHEND